MNVKPFIWLLVPLASNALAQDYNLGVRAQAMGGSGVALATDPEGQFINPAALAQVPNKAMTLSYSRPFGIKEIALASVALGGAFNQMTLGLAVIHFGHAQFEDQTFAFTGALKFTASSRKKETRTLLLGVQSVLRRVQIARYEDRLNWRMHVGLIAPVSKSIAWGAAFGNVLEAGKEKTARAIALGMSYRSPARFIGQFDIFKQTDFPLELRAGGEMLLLAPLMLRVGMSTNPERFTVGIAFHFKPATVHVTTFSHIDLGWTQQYAATIWD